MDGSGDTRRETGAVGLSVLLHLCAVPLFAAIFVSAPIPLPEAISVTSGAFSATIEHRAPHRAPARPVSHEAAKPQRVAVQPVASKPAKKTTQTSARHARGTPAHAPLRVAVAVPAQAPPQAAPAESTSQPTPAAGRDEASSRAPTSAPTDADNPGPAPSAVLARSVEPAPPGGWGQNFRDPTVLDDTAIRDLRARYHGATLVRIQVDADGHPVKVSVESTNVDADARAEIERELSAIRYVPAECNGLPCSASFELRV